MTAPSAPMVEGSQKPPVQNSTQPAGREWVTTIVPEALRTEKWLDNIKDPADLVNKHKELLSYQGRSVALPGKDAKPEDWEAFHAKFRPEKAELYEMPHENWPKDVPYSAEFETAARQEFHKLGLTTAQGKALYSWYVDQNLAALKTMGDTQATRYDADFGKLQTEWGTNFDKEFETAQKALGFIVNGDKEHPIIKWLDSTGENKNPVLIKFFNEIGKKFISEDELRGENNQMPDENELVDVEKKIAEMRADPKGAYMDERNPGHKIAIAEMKALYDRRVALQNAKGAPA